MKDTEFYWVRQSEKEGEWIRKKCDWEIAEYNKKEDAFYFTDSSYSYRKDCFEIDENPIKRPKK